jgi:hypothetical protein
MKPEQKAKEGVGLLLKKYSIWYFKPQMAGLGRAGVPDFIACIRGRMLAVETKALGKRPTPLQQREIDAINAAGGVALVVDEGKLEALEKLLLLMLEAPPLGVRLLTDAEREAVKSNWPQTN